MNRLFESASVKVGKRRVFVSDITGFIDDKVILKNKEQISVTDHEREILKDALILTKKVNSYDQHLSRGNRV